MPRRKRMRIVTVENWGPLRKHRLYPGRIRSATIEGAPDHLRVEIINLDPDELDRTHVVSLPLWPRPGNHTYRLLEVCGFDVSIGARIDLDQIVNRIVGFRLRDHATGESETFDFERITYPPATEAAVTATDSSEIESSESERTERPLADHEIPF